MTFDYGNYVQVDGNFLSIIFAFFNILSVVLYPLLGSSTLTKHFAHLHTPKMRYELGHYYEGIKPRN